MIGMVNSYDYKIAHPDIIKQLSVKDMLFAYYKCPQLEKQVYLFTHYNLITYTIRGKKTFYHKDRSWTLSDNSCLFVRRTAMSQERDDMIGWEVLAFYFGDEFLKQVFKEFRQYLAVKDLPAPPADMLLDIHINETTGAFFYGMIPYFVQQIPPSETLLELKFRELLYNIFSDPANRHFLAFIHSIMDQHKTPLCEIMEANYTYNLSVEEFAKIAQRSVASFKREFKDYYHTTPGKWLIRKRVEYARMLLINSRKNISEIAYDTGFENLTHFSRVFKERHGLSPLQYRQKNINGISD